MAIRPVPTVVRRAPGLLLRVVRGRAVVSLPGRGERLVGGSGTALLLALEKPGSALEVVDRITDTENAPADIDLHQVVLDAIDTLAAAGIVEIETVGPGAPR